MTFEGESRVILTGSNIILQNVTYNEISWNRNFVYDGNRWKEPSLLGPHPAIISIGDYRETSQSQKLKFSAKDVS